MRKILSILMAALFSVSLFAGTKELKVIPGVWSTDNAVIAAWAWEGEGEGAWSTFAGEGDTLSAQVAENANNIIFVRMDPTKDFGWDAEWNRYQTTINWDKAFKVAGWDNYEWVDFAGGDGGEGGDPEPTPDPIVENITIYFVNNLGWENVNAYVWGDSEYKPWPGEAAAKEAEQIHELDVYAYTFPKNNVNIIFNNGSAQTVNLTLDEDKLYFVPGEADLEGKFQGTWYAKAEIPEPTPEPDPVYTLVGPLSPNGWDQTLSAGDMTLIDGLYTFVLADAELHAAAPYEYKIVKNHSYAVAYPQEGNASFTVEQDGVYDITFTLNAATGEYAVNPVLDHATVLDPTAVLGIGDWYILDIWSLNPMELSSDKKSASFSMNLYPGSYRFKFVINDTWRSNGYEYHRNFRSADGIVGDNEANMQLTADYAGEYTFVWTFETNSLEIIFPELPYAIVKGELTSWGNEDKMIYSDDNSYAYFTKNLTAGEYQFKMFVNGEYLSNGYWFDRTETTWAILTSDDVNNMKLVADVDGEYTIVWTFSMNRIEVYRPNLPNRLEDGFYLIGQYGFDVEDLTADLKFGEPDESGQYKLDDVTLSLGQELKVVLVQNDAIVEWFPGGEDTNYVVDQYHVGSTDIYFRPWGDGNDDWHYRYFYVVPTSEIPSAIDNTAVEVKAIKRFVNGQLLIEKAGVLYNAQGAVIK